jgi:hypothetical protein
MVSSLRASLIGWLTSHLFRKDAPAPAPQPGDGGAATAPRTEPGRTAVTRRPLQFWVNEDGVLLPTPNLKPNVAAPQTGAKAAAPTKPSP